MRRIRQLVSVLLSVFLIGYLAWFVQQNFAEMRAALQGSTWQIAGIAVCILISWLSMNMQVLLPIREMGFRVGFMENFAVTMAGTLANYTPIRLGTIIRLNYYKRVHGLGYVRFGGILGVRFLLMIVAAGVLGVVGSAGLLAEGHVTALSVIWFFAILALGGIAIFLIPERWVPKVHRKIDLLVAELISGAKVVRRHPSTAVMYMVLLGINFAALAGELYLSFAVIGVYVPAWTYLLLAPVTALGVVISLTPGNLGLREALIGLIGAAAEVNFGHGMLAGTVDRTVLLALTIVLGAVGLVYAIIRSEYPSLARRLGMRVPASSRDPIVNADAGNDAGTTASDAWRRSSMTRWSS
jgi:uncharacterized membrane protein YbhN (UPF0104 family)